MKKIFLILITFLFMPNVLASSTTYYSEYSDYFYSDEEVLESDTKLVEKHKVYTFYNKVKIDHGYSYHMGYDYIVDYDDYIFTEFSDYHYEYPIIEDYDHQVFSMNYFKHYKMKPFRYLFFDNISGSFGSLRIPEIEIYANGILLNYDVDCFYCKTGFEERVKNGNKIDYLNSVYNGGSFKIDLGDHYYFDELDIRIYLYDVGTTTKTYDMYLFNSDDLDEALLKYTFENDFQFRTLDEIKFFEKEQSNYSFVNPLYEAPIISDNDFSVFPNKTEGITKYKYRKYLYRHYEYFLEECDEYSEDCDVKSDEYEVLYKYKTRSKLELQNDIKISDKSDISDFIIYSNGDVNYQILGDEIIFTLDDLEIYVPFSYLEEKVKEDEIEKPNKEPRGFKVAYDKANENSILKSSDSKTNMKINIGVRKVDDKKAITRFPLFMFSSLLYISKKINDSIY